MNYVRQAFKGRNRQEIRDIKSILAICMEYPYCGEC